MAATTSDADRNASFYPSLLVDIGNARAAVVIESGQRRSVQSPSGVIRKVFGDKILPMDVSRQEQNHLCSLLKSSML